MAIAIALLELNYLGLSVTPAFLWYIWWSSAYIDGSRYVEGGRSEQYSIATALGRSHEDSFKLLAILS